LLQVGRHGDEVSRRDRPATASDELLKQGGCKGCPLLGVGSRTELVVQDERRVVELSEHRRRGAHRRRERRPVREQALIVADPTPDPRERRKRTALLGEHGNAGMSHHDGESDGFQCDRLAARVGPGEEHHAGRRVEVEIEWSYGSGVPGLLEHGGANGREARVEQGVPNAAKVQCTCEPRHQNGGATLLAEESPRLNGVQFGEIGCCGQKLFAVAAEGSDDLGQDPFFLFSCPGCRLGEGVVELDHGERLDEQRCTGCGDVQDQSGEPMTLRHRNGEAVPLTANRQRSAQSPVLPAELLECTDDGLSLAFTRTTRQGERLTRAVENLTVRSEPLLAERQERRELRQPPAERRDPLSHVVVDSQNVADFHDATHQRDEIGELPALRQRRCRLVEDGSSVETLK
jgi:hypothetical protein